MLLCIGISIPFEMFIKSNENYFSQYNDVCITLTAGNVNVNLISTRAYISMCRGKTKSEY